MGISKNSKYRHSRESGNPDGVHSTPKWLIELNAVQMLRIWSRFPPLLFTEMMGYQKQPVKRLNRRLVSRSKPTHVLNIHSHGFWPQLHAIHVVLRVKVTPDDALEE